MEKTRLEAFSDGVFAIAITLLILDIKVPEVAPNDLGRALLALLPNLATYVFSFAVIGLYWVSHHSALRNVTHVDTSALWLNVVYLLFIGFMPFPTALFARYPFEAWPLVIYGGTLMAANVTGLLFQAWARRHPEFQKVPITRPFGHVLAVYGVVAVLYAIAMVLAFWMPAASATVFLVVLAGLVEYNRRAPRG